MSYQCEQAGSNSEPCAECIEKDLILKVLGKLEFCLYCDRWKCNTKSNYLYVFGFSFQTCSVKSHNTKGLTVLHAFHGHSNCLNSTL